MKLFISQILATTHLILNFIITLYRGYLTYPNSHLITSKARTSSEVSWCLAKSSFHSNSILQSLGRPRGEANFSSPRLGMMGSDCIYELVISNKYQHYFKVKNQQIIFFLKKHTPFENSCCLIHSCVQYQK